MQISTERPLLTEPEVAKILAVSPACIRYWRSKGKIKFIRIGVNIRYDPADIEAMINAGRQTSLD